jgi:probable rRNA maturation factor
MNPPVEPDPVPVPVASASAQRGALRVEGEDVVGRPAIEVGRWCEVALTALEAEAVPAGRIDLHFVDIDDITQLNSEHLDGTGPTDVLSFPYEQDPRSSVLAAGAGAEPVVLGDIVICAEVAARQAPDHAGSLDSELALLVVHGVLHVLGWDHAEPGEAVVMQDREAEILSRAGFEFRHPARR